MGLTVQGGGHLENAQAIAVPPAKHVSSGWPPQFLAARIRGPGMGDDVIGVWATGIGDGGPIWALNRYAQEFSDWGAAARPGSRAAEIRDQLANYEEARTVANCV